MKVAAYSGTRNLYYGMVAAYKSLLMHSDVDLVYLLIEDDSFPFEKPDCVKTVNISGQKGYWQNSPNGENGFTYAAMVRATYAHMFPWLSKILSLDCDVIVEQDISELWNLNLNGYYFSATPEPNKTQSTGSIYTNIGVCLYNLDALRDGKADEVIYALKTKQYRFLEQDAMNEYCRGKILPMDGDYNATIFTEHSVHPKITHFAGYSNWFSNELVRKYQNVPLKEVMAAHEETVRKHRI